MKKTRPKEFMPALTRSILLMPLLVPHGGRRKKRVLQQLDMACASIPELKQYSKVNLGEQNHALDPQPPFQSKCNTITNRLHCAMLEETQRYQRNGGCLFV